MACERAKLHNTGAYFPKVVLIYYNFVKMSSILTKKKEDKIWLKFQEFKAFCPPEFHACTKKPGCQWSKGSPSPFIQPSVFPL
jgi:hypothetical protein